MTRKIAAIAAVLMAFPAICAARIPVPSFLKYDGLSLRADVRIGANISDMMYLVPRSGMSYVRMDRVSGLNAGAGLTLDILRGVSLETGVTLTEWGGWDKAVLNNKYASTWLQAPLLLTLGFGYADTVRIYIQGGGYAAYGVGGKTLNEVASYPFFGDDEVATPFDFGLSGGFGACFLEHFRAGLRYDYGLRNISAGNIKKIASLYNETITFHIGYVF